MESGRKLKISPDVRWCQRECPSIKLFPSITNWTVAEKDLPGLCPKLWKCNYSETCHETATVRDTVLPQGFTFQLLIRICCKDHLSSETTFFMANGAVCQDRFYCTCLSWLLAWLHDWSWTYLYTHTITLLPPLHHTVTTRLQIRCLNRTIKTYT